MEHGRPRPVNQSRSVHGKGGLSQGPSQDLGSRQSVDVFYKEYKLGKKGQTAQTAWKKRFEFSGCVRTWQERLSVSRPGSSNQRNGCDGGPGNLAVRPSFSWDLHKGNAVNQPKGVGYRTIITCFVHSAGVLCCAAVWRVMVRCSAA